jgi:hypothetical protein
MLKRTVRSMSRCTAVLAGLVAMLTTLTMAMTAQARDTTPVDRFTFDLPGEWTDFWGDRRFEVSVWEWSDNAKRDEIFDALERRGPEGLHRALRSSHMVGTMNWPGSVTYTLRYAFREPVSGGENIVLIADRKSWLWWDHGLTGELNDYPFTVFRISLDRNGQGQGKSSLTANAVPDAAVGVSLENFDAQPVVLAEVRREVRARR